MADRSRACGHLRSQPRNSEAGSSGFGPRGSCLSQAREGQSRVPGEDGSIAVTLRSFSEEMRIMGFVPGAKLLDQRWVPAEGDVPQALGANVGDPVLEVVRLSLASGREPSLNRSYFPVDYGKLLEMEDLGAPSLYRTVERSVGPITGATELAPSLL